MPDAKLLDVLAARLGDGRPLKVVWACEGPDAGRVRDLAHRLPGTHTVVERARKLRGLEDEVLFGGAHLGLAIDRGRLGVVDGQGRALAPGQTLAILAAEALAARPGAPVVADVLTSAVVFDEVGRLGGRPLMAAAEPEAVGALVTGSGAPLGGGWDGCLFFAESAAAGDPLDAAVRVLAMVGGWTRDTLARRRDRLPHRVAIPVMRLACPPGRAEAVAAEVADRLSASSAVTMDRTDGIRVATADGWWAVRASRREPEVQARCEGRSVDGLKRLRKALADQLAASGIDATG